LQGLAPASFRSRISSTIPEAEELTL
jgi:hypothetical protein